MRVQYIVSWKINDILKLREYGHERTGEGIVPWGKGQGTRYMTKQSPSLALAFSAARMAFSSSLNNCESTVRFTSS